MFRAFGNAMKRYAVFKGRTSRKDFWLFYLCHSLILYIALAVIGGIWASAPSHFSTDERIEVIGIVAAIDFVALGIPSLAAATRRLHDADMPGYYILVPVYNLVLLAKPGVQTENTYGPVPETFTKPVKRQYYEPNGPYGSQVASASRNGGDNTGGNVSGGVGPAPYLKAVSTYAEGAEPTPVPAHEPDTVQTRQTAPDNGMNYCPMCGVKLFAGGRFCTGCGNPVN